MFDMSDVCSHPAFDANVEVARLEDSGRFMADVRITCAQCGTPMRFLGLSPGLNLAGAAVSFDATEARLAIHPMSDPLPPIDGDAIGFTIRGGPPNDQA